MVRWQRQQLIDLGVGYVCTHSAGSPRYPSEPDCLRALISQLPAMSCAFPSSPSGPCSTCLVVSAPWFGVVWAGIYNHVPFPLEQTNPTPPHTHTHTHTRARTHIQVYEPIDMLGLYGLDPVNPVNAISGCKRYIATGEAREGEETAGGGAGRRGKRRTGAVV